MTELASHITAFDLAELRPDGPPHVLDLDLVQEDADEAESGSWLEVAVPGRW
jgi:hypothetical protein